MKDTVDLNTGCSKFGLFSIQLYSDDRMTSVTIQNLDK